MAFTLSQSCFSAYLTHKSCSAQLAVAGAAAGAALVGVAATFGGGAELAAIQAQAYGRIRAIFEAVRAGTKARPFPILAGIL